MKSQKYRITRNAFLCAAVLFTAAACSDEDTVYIPVEPDTSLIAGEDISGAAEIQSDIKTKQSSLVATADGAWNLYAIDAEEKFNFYTPVLTGKGAGTFHLPVTGYSRYCLEMGDNRTMIAPRKIPMEGQANFRDLGGYKTADGKLIKWGLIFRSGRLDGLTDADVSYLATIPLRTVIDFRSNSEIYGSEEKPEDSTDRVPFTVTRQIHYPIEPGNLDVSDYEAFMAMIYTEGPEFMREFMIDINESLVLEYQAEYKAFFAELMNPDNLPLMFHCTAGKDRAGFAAALFLSALGVDHETIMEDYLLTNTMTGVTLEDQIALHGGDEILGTGLYYMNTVLADYIGRAFEIINGEFGGVESFLKKQLEVDVDRMKSIYLY